jgi:hypothetical protein
VKIEQKSIGKMAGTVGYIKEKKRTVESGSIEKESGYFQPGIKMKDCSGWGLK